MGPLASGPIGPMSSSQVGLCALIIVFVFCTFYIFAFSSVIF